MKATLLLLSAVCITAAIAVNVSCGGTSCAERADCVNSSEAKQAGRCAPEVGCVEGTCRAECSGFCRVVRADENPCPLAQICSHAATTTGEDGGRCTNQPIACTQVDDCPLYRPSADGEWSCVDGFCRFPGYRYAWE